MRLSGSCARSAQAIAVSDIRTKVSGVDWEQEQMFEIPRKYRPPKAPDKWPRWRKYTGKRTSCDDCLLSIATGKRLFVSEPARYVRQDAERTAYYCAKHTAMRKQDDGL